MEKDRKVDYNPVFTIHGQLPYQMRHQWKLQPMRFSRLQVEQLDEEKDFNPCGLEEATNFMVVETEQKHTALM